jgi:hypothetical protein
MNLRVLMPKLLLLVSLMIVVLVGLVAGLWTQHQDREVTNPFATVGGDFTLISKDGEVSLSDYNGKVVHSPATNPTRTTIISDTSSSSFGISTLRFMCDT